MSIAQNPPHQVGNITMTIQQAPRTPENQEKWGRRAEALAHWLLAEWEKQQLQSQRGQLVTIASRN